MVPLCAMKIWNRFGFNSNFGGQRQTRFVCKRNKILTAQHGIGLETVRGANFEAKYDNVRMTMTVAQSRKIPIGHGVVNKYGNDSGAVARVPAMGVWNKCGASMAISRPQSGIQVSGFCLCQAFRFQQVSGFLMSQSVLRH